MKFKVRFQKRSSVIITILACASSILMLVKRFGFPEEQVVQIVWISFGFLIVIMLFAAVIALFFRWLAIRQERNAEKELSERGES